VNVRRLSELSEREARHKIFGVVVGVVTNNKDDDGHYRVKVKFPWMPGSDGTEEESHWCRVTTFMAGNGRGGFFLPEVNDEVLVAFEHGEISQPYVVGALWNGKDKPTYDNKDGKNNIRAFKSRSGHLFEFSDEDGKEKITLQSKGNAVIVIDDKAKTITITGQTDSNSILIDSQNSKIAIKSKDIELTATGNVKIEAQQKITTKSSTDTEMTASANFKVAASANMEFKSNGQGTVQASGQLVVKGAVVNIN
jgi:uncharacterized protein involved in type VI secretion and phage assembly